MMEGKIVDFTALLRANGLRVSMSEHLDAFHAITELGLADRQSFKDALRATMVKRAVDLPVYDELFELYFSGLAQVVQDAAGGLMQSMQISEQQFQSLMEQLAEILKDLNLDLSALAQALLQNDTGKLEQLLRQAADQADAQGIERSYQEGRYSHSTAQSIGLGNLSDELEQVKGAIGNANLPPEQNEALQQFIEQRLRDLREMIRRTVRLELEKRDQSQREKNRMASLAEKSFYYLSEDELRRMREAVTKLAQRLKNVVSIRRKRGKRGKFDLADTMRKNLQYGGVPFRIQFDRRVKDKPQVLVLCDVSDSVRNVSRFMLQFVYSLQDLYSRVRSFIFVSEIGEITQLFEENDTQRAIEQALTGSIINVFAHSDFGRAFKTFHRDYLGAVNNRTTVILLGDARNNYNLAHEWVLRDIQARAKQVIWLNPEGRLTWGFGDSEMDRYLPFCDMVEECRNLNQLYRVVDRLVR
ncbi:MAG: VWA domain-containing protein [bacterium]